MKSYNTIVIGAGPGGYIAALRLAQLGKTCALVGSHDMGGTCLNRGCVPTKALLHAARPGVSAEELYSRKQEIVTGQQTSISALVEAWGIDCYPGYGKLGAERTVTVGTGDDAVTLQGEQIVIAVGAVPSVPPIPGADLPGVLTSDDVLDRAMEMPESIVIIGGGVIGSELAYVYHNLGVKVTVIEALDRLLANMDKEFGQSLSQQMKKDGITVTTKAKVEGIAQVDGKLGVTYLLKDEQVTVKADRVLIATGRKAATADLCQEGFALEMNRGMIVVNDQFATSEPGIYAIGDCSGGIQLAHVASAQAKVVAEIICGETPSINLATVPSCVYTQPEIASVGMTEAQAKEAGIATISGKYIMGGNAKTVIDELSRSFVRLVFRADDHVLIGAQLLCGRASDMIGGLAIALNAGLKAEDIAATIMPHPSYVEGIGEAAEIALGCCAYSAPSRKR